MARRSAKQIQDAFAIYDQLPEALHPDDLSGAERIIELAEKRVSIERQGKLSRGTLATYDSALLRIDRFSDGETWKSFMDQRISAHELVQRFTSEPRTAAVYRSAMRRKLVGGLMATSKRMLDGHHPRQVVAQALLTVFTALRSVEALPPDTNTKAWFAPAGPSRARKSKRDTLPKDPAWRERLWEHVSKKQTKYLSALAILDTIGCRPAELLDGVELGLNDNIDQLSLVIQTAKRDPVEGKREWRIITVRIETAASRHLAALVLNTDGPIVVKLDANEPSLISDQIRDWGQQIGYVGLSAYSYKHQASSDLRGNGDRKLVAKFMGHASAENQRFYGKCSRSGSRRRELLVSVQASSEPQIRPTFAERMAAEMDDDWKPE